MTDDPIATKQAYDERRWPFETITPKQFYSLPIEYRLAFQKLVRDMVDGKKAEH